MKKTGKFLLGLAVFSAGVGAAIAYFSKRENYEDNDEFHDNFEEEDFDLDDDLEPVGQRDYVSLSKQSPASESSDVKTDSDSDHSSDTTNTDQAGEEISHL